MKQALVVIDAQKDYEQGGKVPLVNMDKAIECIEDEIKSAQQKGTLIILIQHVNPANSAVFAQGTEGAEIIDSVKNLLPAAPVVQKRYGSSFDETPLDDILAQHGITHLRVVGMMTQNCVVFTVLAPQAKQYDVEVVANGCTSVSDLVHQFALRGVARFVRVV